MPPNNQQPALPNMGIGMTNAPAPNMGTKAGSLFGNPVMQRLLQGPPGPGTNNRQALFGGLAGGAGAPNVPQAAGLQAAPTAAGATSPQQQADGGLVDPRTGQPAINPITGQPIGATFQDSAQGSAEAILNFLNQAAQNSAGGGGITSQAITPVDAVTNPAAPEDVAGNPDWTSPEGLSIIAEMLPPDLQQLIFSSIPDWSLGEKDELIQALGGIFGQGGTLGISSEQGGAPIGMATNLSFADYLQGAQRGEDRENLLAQIAQQAGGSQAAAAGQHLSEGASLLADPGQTTDLFRQREEQVRRDNAGALNRTRNRLSDLGLSGMGGAGVPGTIAAERGASRDLADQLLGLDALEDQTRRQNLAAAAGAGAVGTDIFRALNIDPQLNLASSLGAPQNIQSQQFQNMLTNIGQLASGMALADRGPSTLQELAPIIGGGLTGIGNIFGGTDLSELFN